MIATTEAYGLTFSYPAGDTAVGACLRDYGEFSRMGATLVCQMARGRGFLDVGANIGAFALAAFRSAASVVAIEAHPGLAELLQRNVSDNQAANIQVLHAAAGAEPGRAAFPCPPLSTHGNFGATGFAKNGYPTTDVDLVRLDDVAPSDTAMVKIDVEGFEVEVLRGADRLLHEVRPAWLIEYNSPAVLSLLRDADYRTYWFYDAFVTPYAPKKRWAGNLRGDLCIFAIPPGAPAPAGMVEAFKGDERPTSSEGFEYFRAFGLTPQ